MNNLKWKKWKIGNLKWTIKDEQFKMKFFDWIIQTKQLKWTIKNQKFKMDN